MKQNSLNNEIKWKSHVNSYVATDYLMEQFLFQLFKILLVFYPKILYVF